jgi:hypothetical protein
MAEQIRISSQTLNRLKALAMPYVDREPEDTLKRLLDQAEARDRGETCTPHDSSPLRAIQRQDPIERIPRSRGAVVKIGSQHIQAASVRDLYEQALKYLVETHAKALSEITPFSTSRQRHLIAKGDRHPTGHKFVVPVTYKGYYMEAHKDYRNGIRHLEQLAKRLKLDFKYDG